MVESKQIRVTVMLNASVATLLREKQAKLLMKRGKSVSFSKVLNDELIQALNFKAMKKVGAKRYGTKKTK